LAIIKANPDSSLGVKAGQALLEYGGSELIVDVLDSGNRTKVNSAIKALAHIGNKQAWALLQAVAVDNSKSLQTRKEAVKAMGSSWSGEKNLLAMANSGKLPPTLKPTAKHLLLNARRGDVRKKATKLFGSQSLPDSTNLQSIEKLVQMKGDPSHGKKIFVQTCQVCHQVKGEGTQFGPDLSKIGSKLPKKGLYEAILHPSAGISYGYAGYIFTLKDGSKISGIISSEVANQLALRMMGGYTKSLDKSNIKSRKKMDRSLMPDNVASSLSQQELADLVEYLSSLK
jgi:putative heme-binding domain-containing protein